MHTILLVSVKPLLLAITGLIVWAVSAALNRLIPEGRIKRFLYKQRGANAAKQAQPAAPASKPRPAPAVKLLESPASRHL